MCAQNKYAKRRNAYICVLRINMQSGVDALPSPMPSAWLPTSPRGAARRCSPFWPNLLPGVLPQLPKVLRGVARRHPSTSRSYYRSTHPASTRRGRAPAGCAPLTAGDSPGIREAEPFRI